MKRNDKKDLKSAIEATELQFNAEIAGSERLRVLILIGALGLEAILLMVIYFFYRQQYLRLFKTDLAFYAILIFIILIALYGMAARYFLEKKMHTFFHHRSVLGYLNVFSEITLLSGLFVFIVEYSGQPAILQAPASLTYFLFIILSTLRLDFRLSVFTGTLAALEYVAVSVYYSSESVNALSGGFYNYLTGMQYLGQGVLLLVSGVAAGFVADLIKKKILASWKNIRDKNEIIALFGQQISPQIADSILQNRDKLTGSRKNVCVMFLDIRGFTPFVESHRPEEVVTYLNTLFHFMIDSVMEKDGAINQFLGDGFMATFGAPLSEGNISQKAVSASIDIIQKIRELNHSGEIPHTRIGIGLHYGEAIVGNIGSAVRKQYSITGNVVVMASRIEQLNKLWHTQLIISEEVYRELDEDIRSAFLLQQPVQLKGMNQPATLYVLNENN